MSEEKILRREVAHRAFAQEYNASSHKIEGQGEKDPSFLVTPLGAKVNRIHIVGVCTDVEPVGEAGDQWRARISDPSGVFTLYAGKYQPEAAQMLSQLQPPCFLAVTGKSRTYEPEPGKVFVSISPEKVTVVDEETRDLWIIDTARHTKARIAAIKQGKESKEPVGTAVLAQQAYGDVDVTKYEASVKTCLQAVVSGTMPTAPPPAAKPGTPAPAKPATNDGRAIQPPPAENAAEKALDDEVLATVAKLEGAKGAKWDDVLSVTIKGNLKPDDIEASLNRLMDKGLIYEPTLGVLKTT